MDPRLWTVTDRALEAARWKSLLKGVGVRCSQRLDSISALSQAGGEKAEGLALLDADLLTGRAAERVGLLRQHCPGVQLVIVCSNGALQGPDLADALASGALDYLCTASSDETLIDKLKFHIERLFPRILESVSTRFKDLRVDWRCRIVEVQGEAGWREIAALTPKEFDLLRVLFELKGRKVSREELLERVWKARAGSVNPEAVDKQVGSLRRKLGRAGDRIKTVRGFGYALKA
ncbi:MAG: hypothetical protein COB53_11930 [Elusimicrobia bacterium]|nr:MAG: hypothetical protein COB53_11930 [Elusimicrobiota bacterium]